MINKQTEDRDLIGAYIKGNDKAFELLLMRHKNKIHRFIFMKLHDQDLTEDIFQETFIKVINTFKNGSYKRIYDNIIEENSFTMFPIVINIFNSYLEKIYQNHILL